MRLEILQLTAEEQRVLLLFDPITPASEDPRVDAYLQEHGLEPKRHYRETRRGKEYVVYYFGHCYLEGHLEHLTSLASEAVLPS